MFLPTPFIVPFHTEPSVSLIPLSSGRTWGRGGVVWRVLEWEEEQQVGGLKVRWMGGFCFHPLSPYLLVKRRGVLMFLRAVTLHFLHYRGGVRGSVGDCNEVLAPSLDELHPNLCRVHNTNQSLVRSTVRLDQKTKRKIL